MDSDNVRESICPLDHTCEHQTVSISLLANLAVAWQLEATPQDKQDTVPVTQHMICGANRSFIELLAVYSKLDKQSRISWMAVDVITSSQLDRLINGKLSDLSDLIAHFKALIRIQLLKDPWESLYAAYKPVTSTAPSSSDVPVCVSANDDQAQHNSLLLPHGVVNIVQTGEEQLHASAELMSIKRAIVAASKTVQSLCITQSARGSLENVRQSSAYVNDWCPIPLSPCVAKLSLLYP